MKQKQKAPINIGNPVYQYTSDCCSGPASKPPCVKPRDKKEALTNSLGSWRCDICRKPCKVSRHKQKLDKVTED